MHLVPKFLKNPEKAEKMVEEEEREKDGGQPLSMRRERAAEKKVNMAQKKKNQISKKRELEETKKKDKKSKKGKGIKSKKETYNRRTLGKKGKHSRSKNTNKMERKTKKKRKLTSRGKKMNEKKNKTQRNKEQKTILGKSEELENCTSLWAELTRAGLGIATTVKKQVMDFDLVIKVDSLAGSLYKKQRQDHSRQKGERRRLY